MNNRLSIERRLGDWLRAHLPEFAADFVMFGAKMAWASIFAGYLLIAIILAWLFYPADAGLARYDALVVAAILGQVAMIALRLESVREVKVILLFHISGTVMEIFKLAQGSWDYPLDGVLQIAGVPLFTGFMYASVGSFIARAIRIFDMRFVPFPPFAFGALLASAIYLNFFTHHYIWDLRWVLIALTVVLFGRTWVYFTPSARTYWMPFVLSAFLASLFLYVAENIGTLTGTWVYAGTADFSFTNPAKITSWYLLLYLAFMQVVWIYKGVLLNRDRASPEPGHKTVT